jgi:hypothetical protein
VADSTIMNRRDVQFLLYEWLDVAALVERERYAEHSRETFDAVLDLSEQLATNHFRPLNAVVDANEPFVGDDGKVVLPPSWPAPLRRIPRPASARASSTLPTAGCSCRSWCTWRQPAI